ncbi:helix-turn-helix domain-containing protein [Aliagarivorans taiwanensis]|uniref:helix-turn-helix domain-containing protein n=1 Tax=Aliagarivorans taiwanensis TaxID=561966 RepID=UPI00041E4E1E|nr:XRE family transcriptional regulator [Aliagarivorans taiwanensis]
MQEFDSQLGEKLRAIRRELGWSLDTAAKHTGVSKAMLGQIERGESSPTVARMWKIATGMQRPLTAFLDMSATLPEDPALLSQDVRPGDLSYQVLLPFDPTFGFELFAIGMTPGQQHLSEAHDHGVTEHVTVIQGELEILIDQQWLTLKQGEVYRFAANRPHGYRNTSENSLLFHNLIHYQ